LIQQALFAANAAPTAQVISLRQVVRERLRSVWAARLEGLLTEEQIAALRAALGHRRIVVCFGAGVDSTALLIILFAAGIEVELITFADTGGEKPQTYAHVALMGPVLKSWGYPEVAVCRKLTRPDTPYSDLEGNCLENQTLPSLAFGLKTCSIKWKQGPQDQFLMGVKSGPNTRAPHPLWLETQASGERILKLIGYDSGPADLRRAKSLSISDAAFDMAYPLQLIGWTRAECVKAIVQVLGPAYVPIKSACFFCPASKQWELFWLAAHHPELFERALRLEYTALTGRHSRFDSIEFGATWEESELTGDRFPSTETTVGLGRSFSWNQWARTQGIVDEQHRVRRELSEQFARQAELLRADDNALDARACA